ncbi:aldehyde dehydrogenase family protein [Microbacterium trichothecenolyticum]|uniref:Putative aldehyde dehydrogenase AldA n=1 Tax=Microbacterium trichothecenolyticum TaxID=69370 RepID=A0A0M2HDM9_MICTR|nr:aldehyde dehydrogenase family protein [Microbacterium trichothecenolyticum]KJL42336.1 putative aldehyde dehydrogenase AldA [Microbacterium trichothecenolyticum]
MNAASALELHRRVADAVLPEPSLHIAGSTVTRTQRGTLDRIDPTTGALLATFPLAGQQEVDDAVAAARKAFPAWRRLSADRRRRILWDVARAIEAHEEELNQIVALETGFPVGGGGMSMAIDYFEYYAGWVDKFEGELITTYPTRALDYVKFEPHGIVGAFVPFNGPVLNAAMKLAPAFAAGNCVILKSPEMSPFGVMRLAEICREAGLPDGVLSVLSGDKETGQAIIRHADVSKVVFTGGGTVARSIMATAAESLTPVTLELGGKSANVIFEDADLDAAAQVAAFVSTVAVAGQGCLFPTRLMVQESVYDEVIERVAAVSSGAKIGDPLDPSVQMGPVISEGAADRILSMVEAARQQVRVVTGGERLAETGLGGNSFLRPTVLADVDNSSPIAQQEVFGPVLAVMPFTDEAHALAMANDNALGLAAYVHTNDLTRAHRFADSLEAGWVGVNGFPDLTASAPFGGVKGSGFGREGGRAGIEEYVYRKNVHIPLP